MTTRPHPYTTRSPGAETARPTVRSCRVPRSLAEVDRAYPGQGSAKCIYGARGTKRLTGLGWVEHLRGA
jgi:hypothetical protein